MSLFNGEVCIVGAGAAGLTAGYTLKQGGVSNVTILEASSRLGGRLKKLADFASFPIDLGGEWIQETTPSILDDITGVPGTSDKLTTFLYDTNPYFEWEDGAFNAYKEEVGDNYRFINYTWFDFFNDYIAPSVVDEILFDMQVVTIDYSGNDNVTVRIVTKMGDIFDCDRAIVTVPLQILKDGDIEFIPPFSSERLAALKASWMAPGLKVFLEFSETFYPVNFGFERNNAAYETGKGDHLYFDEAFMQSDSSPDPDHILGFFAVGVSAEPYLKQRTEGKLRDYILAELDMLF